MKKIMMQIKKNTSLRILSISIIAVFLVLVARVTYAYFAPEFSDAWQNVGLKSDLVDKFRFTIGDPLVINATTSSLPENGANLVSHSTSSASLIANNTTNKASYNYKVYFKISDNNFVYSDGITPEIILSVTDNDNNPITNIDGLTYGTFNGVEGFDVTTANGMFMVANPNITSESSTNATVQEWHFSLTYLNLSFDQSTNYNHALKTEVILEEAKNTDNFLANYIIKQYTDGSNGLYFHNDALANGANDNSYRYSGANPNNYVCFGYDGSKDSDNWCPDDNLYRIIGVFNNQVKLVKAYEADAQTLGVAQNGTVYKSAADYKGKRPTIPGYYWSGSASITSNNWITAEMNTNILNSNTSNYLNKLGTWTNLIADTYYQISGVDWSLPLNLNASQIYQAEITASTKNDIKKIGLMYVSDYMYAASANYWTKVANGSEDRASDYSSAANDNWLNIGAYQWFITPTKNMDGYAYTSDLSGFVSVGAIASGICVIRPVFYLNSDVTLGGGSGTEAKPYYIEIKK